MNNESLVGMFKSHAFLNQLGDRLLLLLASGARPFRAAPDTYLARNAEPAHAFYLIQSGHVAIEVPATVGGTAPLQTVGPGEVVGWSWLLPPHRWQFDARALDEVQGIAFDATWLRDQCEQNHELGYHLLKQLLTVVSARLAATRRQLLHQSLESAAHGAQIAH